MSIRAHDRSAPGSLQSVYRACRRQMLGILLLTLGGAVLGDTATGSREYQIKAAFLYNFTRFTEWPANSFADARSPIRIGTYCADPFSSMLEKLVENRAVNGRRIVVTRFQSADAARSAHVVFVCADSDEMLARVEEVARISPVLTISEADGPADGIACIKFLVDGGKVHFEINVTASERAGLKISAQLQKLAKAVRRTP